MITFDIDFSHSFNEDSFLYRLKEYSFEYSSSTQTDIGIFIDCLEIEADSQSGIVCGINGFCAYTMWKKEKLDVPRASKGQLKICENLESGTTKRIMENTPVYFDSDTGWICIGKPSTENCTSVEFAENAIASLNNHRLVALWVKPEFV